jgi:hypothetical protein
MSFLVCVFGLPAYAFALCAWLPLLRHLVEKSGRVGELTHFIPYPYIFLLKASAVVALATWRQLAFQESAICFVFLCIETVTGQISL